jgi:glutamyl-Q tRNA(Asp) synthetase
MASSSGPVYRFAPSPNGLLHLGHAFSALTNEKLARDNGGRLLLRIEDIDTERCRPEFETRMIEDLDWLGIRFDGPVRRQSEHFADYRAAVETLARDGLVYPGFLSRTEVRALILDSEARGKAWPRDPDGAPLYPEQDRTLSDAERTRLIAEGAPHAWRLDMSAAVARAGPVTWREGYGDPGLDETIAARPQAWGDVLIARRDTPTSYHLSVVLDDALQGVTHVVRGRDLFEATAVHRLLQALTGIAPPRYFHHALVTDADGRKLSKSRKDTSLSDLRSDGFTAAEIRRRLGF